MKTSTMGEFEMPDPHCSRRGFMLRTISLIATAAAFSVFTPLAAQSDAGPNAADLEIATLGDWLREAEPDSAAQLEADARKATRLTPTQSVDWPTAQLARVLLTEDARIAAELARADVVFVDGWLLARSEAGAALLFAEARAQMQFQSQTALAG
jgi:hypothetical protein